MNGRHVRDLLRVPQRPTSPQPAQPAQPAPRAPNAQTVPTAPTAPTPLGLTAEEFLDTPRMPPLLLPHELPRRTEPAQPATPARTQQQPKITAEVFLDTPRSEPLPIAPPPTNGPPIAGGPTASQAEGAPPNQTPADPAAGPAPLGTLPGGFEVPPLPQGGPPQASGVEAFARMVFPPELMFSGAFPPVGRAGAVGQADSFRSAAAAPTAAPTATGTAAPVRRKTIPRRAKEARAILRARPDLGLAPDDAEAVAREAARSRAPVEQAVAEALMRRLGTGAPIGFSRSDAVAGTLGDGRVSAAIGGGVGEARLVGEDVSADDLRDVDTFDLPAEEDDAADDDLLEPLVLDPETEMAIRRVLMGLDESDEFVPFDLEPRSQDDPAHGETPSEFERRLNNLIGQIRTFGRKFRRRGLTGFVPPETRKQFASLVELLPTQDELLPLATAVTPVAGERQALRDYFDAADRTERLVRDGRFDEARASLGDTGAALVGVMPLVGAATRASGKGARIAAKRGKRPGKSGAPSAAKTPATRLPTTPGGGEAARLAQIKSQRRITPQPPGTFDQTAEAAFRATAFPPRDAAENIRRGLAAVDKALKKALKGGKGVIQKAMHRDDVGSIMFLWGEAGDPLNGYRPGFGLSHIIAKHGVEVIEPVLEAIARAAPVPNHLIGAKVVLEHGGHRVVLSRRFFGKRETWLVTGFMKGPNTDIPTNLNAIAGAFFFRR